MVDAPEFKIYSILVSKLNCYGLDMWTITGKNWLAGELYPKDSNNPIPQGSILGPVLFNSLSKTRKQQEYTVTETGVDTMGRTRQLAQEHRRHPE